MDALSSQFTPTFPALLRQAGMALAVSTYQAGKLVLLRAHDDGLNTHFIGMRRPMGIAVGGNDRLAIGDATRVQFFRNVPAVGRNIDDGRCDAAYLHRATHVTGDIDGHEMVFDDAGTLWLVNTRMSCLCTLSPEFSVVPRWTPPFITGYDLLDRCHLNGLGLRDGAPRYVTLLGASDSPGGWRAHKADGGQLLDITDDSVLARGLCMPHSPRWHRGQVWFLDSGEGALKRIEADGSIATVCELPGFTRGLDFVGRYALVGLSKVRETASFAGLPLTRRVGERRCGVYLVDIDAGSIAGFLHFTGDVQEIFDVKLLPHRHPALVEADAALLATSFELPQAAVARVVQTEPLLERMTAAARLFAAGRHDDAIAAYRAIVDESPGHLPARLQLGLALVHTARWDAAREVLAALVARDPDHADAHNSLGLCLARLGEHEHALACLDRALAIDREFALAHVNRALLLLATGRHADGWRDYAWRTQLPSFAPLRCAQPQWQGEPIAAQRLLVHGEQGLREQIFGWRFLAAARARCRELIYVGAPPLAALAAQVAGVDESRAADAIPRDRFDVFSPLLDLPRCLGLADGDVGLVATQARYVQPPAHLRPRTLRGARRVGIAWRDGAGVPLPLEALAAALAVDGITAFSVQPAPSATELDVLRTAGIENLEPELHDLAHTAAMLDRFDLVIGADTATVHLACALGIATWIVLDEDPAWMFGTVGERTPWYPTARLFRRARGKGWDTVIERVRDALQAWRSATPAPD
ncbi:TIGR03032 family protein [Chiayiivirga flava]|uniref:Uncharacterized protein (TIGR03032 family) n=1 Tax=Chiayiivirga flava TaxID=659595 RepID=A0A7W8D562_9GAMM|nr:TIGR03032 family protein [Chiayiivirga flava]MBB5208123.1 uncharacterized protein (TIGR03032 family) [Chiayiivirga flava]